MTKPLIFLTNDDGVNAKGFRNLIDTVRPLGRIIAVAPENGQSGMSHAITMTRPLYLTKVEEEEGVEIYACSGTPVDCVKIAFDSLLLNIKGIRPCRQTRGYWREEFERRQDPRGKDYYWLIGYFNNAEPEAEDTDEWALKHGYISVVPIQVDLTNYKQLGDLKDWSFTGRQKESGDTKSEPCPVPPSSKADFWE